MQTTSRGSVALIAALAVVIALVSFLIFAPPIALISCVLGWAMLAVAVIDAQQFIVPDALSLTAIPAGLLVAYALDDGLGAPPAVLEHIAAAVLGGAALYAIRQFYYVWRQREGLGLGDVKLAAAAGAWVGLSRLGPVLLLAGLLAIGSVLVCNLRDVRAIRGTMAVPFGVFLAPSIWFVWGATMVGTDSGLLGLLTRP